MKGYMSGMILEEPDLSAPMREWLVWRLELKQMDQNDLSVRFAVGSALRLLRQRAIAVITTGGTIGALPYPDPSRPPAQATMPEVRNFVEEAVAEDPRVILLRMQPCDSNAIDETYRLLIRVSINAIPSRAAVVTHGTDTILETADWLYARRAELEKPGDPGRCHDAARQRTHLGRACQSGHGPRVGQHRDRGHSYRTVRLGRWRLDAGDLCPRAGSAREAQRG